MGEGPGRALLLTQKTKQTCLQKGEQLHDDSAPYPPSKRGQNFNPVEGVSGYVPLALEHEDSNQFLSFFRETETYIRVMTNLRSHSKLVTESE